MVKGEERKEIAHFQADQCGERHVYVGCLGMILLKLSAPLHA